MGGQSDYGEQAQGEEAEGTLAEWGGHKMLLRCFWADAERRVPSGDSDHAKQNRIAVCEKQLGLCHKGDRG